MEKTGYSALKQVAVKAPTAYWYKINGKKCSKAAYNAYKNKPGGDEGGKSTNDPDPSGNKAKTEKARSNNAASKKATVQTKKQSELTPLKQTLNGKELPKGYTKKDEKFLKKQNEDVVRREDLDAKGKAIWDKNHAKSGVKKKTKKSPLEFSWKDALDNTQTALTAGGMFPVVGNVADLLNVGVSGGRAAYSKFKGDKKGVKEHMVNAGLNLASAIPIAGQAVAGTKLAKVAVGKGAFDKALQIREGRDAVARNFKKGNKTQPKLIAAKKGTPKVNNIA